MTGQRGGYIVLRREGYILHGLPGGSSPDMLGLMDMVMVMLTGLRWWASSESGLKLRTGGAYWWREGGGGKKRAREGGWVGE